MGEIVSFANQKGGVGKTTTAINVAAVAAQLGRKILLVDLDPQTNATSGLGIDPNELATTIYEVLIDGVPVRETVVATYQEGLALLPSSQHLTGAKVELLRLAPDEKETLLRRVLAEIRDEYDHIFIDCPPSLDYLTVNALAASDSVLIPLQCEYYALQGLAQMLETITLVRETLNERLAIKGIALTMYNPTTRLAKDVVADVREHFGDTVYRTLIPRNVRLSEAPGYGEAVITHAPESSGAAAYINLTKEVIGYEETPEEGPGQRAGRADPAETGAGNGAGSDGGGGNEGRHPTGAAAADNSQSEPTA